MSNSVLLRLALEVIDCCTGGALKYTANDRGVSNTLESCVGISLVRSSFAMRPRTRMF